jgi:nitric oxide synthase oxygenase domain/subunit
MGLCTVAGFYICTLGGVRRLTDAGRYENVYTYSSILKLSTMFNLLTEYSAGYNLLDNIASDAFNDSLVIITNVS